MAEPPTEPTYTPILDQLLEEARTGRIRATGRHHLTQPSPAGPDPRGWFEPPQDTPSVHADTERARHTIQAATEHLTMIDAAGDGRHGCLDAPLP